MKKILFIFLVIPLLYGCLNNRHSNVNIDEKDMFTLNNEDLEWLTADTCLIFRSIYGNIDTIRSSGYIISDDSVQSYRSLTCRNNHIKFFIVECIQRFDNDRLDVSITFRKRINDPDNPDIQVYNRKIVSKEISLGRKNFDECIVIDSWDTDSLFYYKREKGGNVSKAVFAKGIGLIFYKMEDGEEFTRVFN